MDAVEEERFRQFVSSRSRALLHTAFLLTGDPHDAQDLLQIALTATARRWSSIRDREQPEPYVRRAMYRHQINRWRQRARRGETLVAAPPDRSDGADVAGYSSAHRDVLDALATLPKKQRAVVVLRYYEDRSESEVARILGVSLGTVRSQASRALAKLRERERTHPLSAAEEAYR